MHIKAVQNSVTMLANKFLKQLQKSPAAIKTFPKYRFGRSMHAVYSLIASELNIAVYKVTLGGFDTHAKQAKNTIL